MLCVSVGGSRGEGRGGTCYKLNLSDRNFQGLELETEFIYRAEWLVECVYIYITGGRKRYIYSAGFAGEKLLPYRG